MKKKLTLGTLCLFHLLFFILLVSTSSFAAAGRGTVDVTEYLVSGDLTTNGTQYSTEVVATSADTVYTIASGTFKPMEQGAPIYVYAFFEPTLKCSTSASGDVTWAAMAKDTDATTWVTLATVTLADIGTTYTDSELKGYMDMTSSTDLDAIPFQWKVVFECDEDGEGKGKLKNTSHIQAVFRGYW
jgi:hypothetical protein